MAELLPEDWAEWGARTGRYRADRIPFWRAQLRAERSRVLASGGRPEPSQVEATIRSLYPAYAPGMSALADNRIEAAGYRMPQVAASPPRPAAFPNAVEELRATNPALVAAAERGGPAPSMFAGGSDYPSSTASGIDVTATFALPWRARLAAAWAVRLGEAHRIVENYADSEFGEWQAIQDLANHPAVADYMSRVRSWAATSGAGPVEPPYAVEAAAGHSDIDDDLYYEMFRDERPASVEASAGAGEDDDLDKAIARLSPPRTRQELRARQGAALAQQRHVTASAYDEDDEDEIDRLSPPRR